MTLDDQIDRLADAGYPELLKCGAADFRKRLEPLRAHVPAPAAGFDIDAGQAGFVLVVNCEAAAAGRTLPRVVRNGWAATEKLFPRDPGFFRPYAGLGVPAGDAYLLLHVDRGNATLNAVPTAAQAQLAALGRSPLTIEEGIAVLTQCPDFLQPNRCFMMLGSRGADKRVPALWLSGKQPKLGWCWEGNPHTWLGFASCAARSPAVPLLQ